MAQTVSKNATASWGVYGTFTDVTGVITDLSISQSALTGAEQNEVGSIIQQTLYDVHSTITVTVGVDSDEQPPDIGQQVTIANVKYYVTSAEIIESNSAYRKIRITAERYSNCEEAKNAEGITTT